MKETPCFCSYDRRRTPQLLKEAEHHGGSPGRCHSLLNCLDFQTHAGLELQNRRTSAGTIRASSSLGPLPITVPISKITNDGTHRRGVGWLLNIRIGFQVRFSGLFLFQGDEHSHVYILRIVQQMSTMDGEIGCHISTLTLRAVDFEHLDTMSWCEQLVQSRRPGNLQRNRLYHD